MFKTALAAAAVALSVALPVVAQTLPEPPQPWWEKGVHSDLTDEQIKSACRLSAANFFPNLLDAWDNEMRSRTYQNCLSWQQRFRQAVQPQRPAVTSRMPTPAEIDKMSDEEIVAGIASGSRLSLPPTPPPPRARMVATLPTAVGTCSETTITKLDHRLEGEAWSGSFVSYANSGRQVSSNEVPAIGRSRVGDRVLMCLTFVPQQCPPGDDRGRVYKTRNLRTGEVWEEPDSTRHCGGA
jgi:hypothetical protein